MALAFGATPRMTTWLPPATTPSLADILHRRSTCLPLLLLRQRPWPVRWPSALVMARVQVEAWRRLQRPQARQAPPATARVRLTAEPELSIPRFQGARLKPRPFKACCLQPHPREFSTPRCPHIRQPCRGLPRRRRKWHNGPIPPALPPVSWPRSASPLRDRIRTC